MSSETGPEGKDPVESQRTVALSLAMSTYLDLMKDSKNPAGVRKEAADKIMDIYDKVLANSRGRGSPQPPNSAFLALVQSPQGNAALLGLGRLATLAANPRDETPMAITAEPELPE